MLQGHTNLATAQEGTQLDSRHSRMCYSYSAALLVASLSCLLGCPYCSIIMLPAFLLQCCNFNLSSVIKSYLKQQLLWHTHILSAKGKSNQFTQTLQYTHYRLFTYSLINKQLTVFCFSTDRSAIYAIIMLKDMYSKRISPQFLLGHTQIQTCWSCGKRKCYDRIFIANYFKKSITSVRLLFCLSQTSFFSSKSTQQLFRLFPVKTKSF